MSGNEMSKEERDEIVQYGLERGKVIVATM